MKVKEKINKDPCIRERIRGKYQDMVKVTDGFKRRNTTEQVGEGIMLSLHQTSRSHIDWLPAISTDPHSL
jgi:hypothetical protein